MRLHRTISPDLPLLVVALEEEATHLHISELPGLVTGAGLRHAALAVATILADWSPSRVVNLGTAGALRDGVVGTNVIRSVSPHDPDAEPIPLGGSGLRLTSGDMFVRDESTRALLAQHADLVDMEGYAVARASLDAGIPVTLVKQVSDSAGAGAGRSWLNSVDECAEALGAWAREHLLG